MSGDVTVSATSNVLLDSFVVDAKLIADKFDALDRLYNFFINVGLQFAKNIPSISNKCDFDYFGIMSTNSSSLCSSVYFVRHFNVGAFYLRIFHVH